MHVTGYDSTSLYIHLFDEISEEVIDKFNEGFNRYLFHNEPIQYLT